MSIGTTYVIHLDPLETEVFVTHSRQMLWCASAWKQKVPVASTRENTFIKAMQTILEKLHEQTQDQLGKG